MRCPNCGSKTNIEGEVCARCGEGPVGAARVLAETYRSGRRNTILGVLLLLGACLIMLTLISKSMPPFLAFLWTCWVFLWGVIALAEGGNQWFSAHRHIKASAFAVSKHLGGTEIAEGPDPGRRTDGANVEEMNEPSRVGNHTRAAQQSQVE